MICVRHNTNPSIFLSACLDEAGLLRYDRGRGPSGLTLQLQRAIDDDRAVSHVVSAVNERRHYKRKTLCRKIYAFGLSN